MRTKSALVTRQLHLAADAWLRMARRLPARRVKIPAGERDMRPVMRVSVVVAIALAMVVISCRKETDAKSTAQVVQVAQDTMLLHDLAEANKNTAAAASV